MWTVTRQCQYPDGNLVIEISSGGYDYCNPGALGEKYPGEGQEYTDPRHAVEAAIAIANRWAADKPEEEIFIGRGGTGGYTMPFDPEPLTPETFAEYRQWAADRYEKLPKCDHCGEVIGKEKWSNYERCDDVFCSENCANQMAEEYETDVE